VNLDKKTGLVCPPKNPEALSQAMVKLWKNGTETQKMAEQALARYKSNFTGELMANSYANLYEELLRQDK
jgi:rhamnosyl/mannosyltransferase